MLLPDGKIIWYAYRTTVSAYNKPDTYALVLGRTDGKKIDSSFGVDGFYETPFNVYGQGFVAATITPRQDVLIGGEIDDIDANVLKINSRQATDSSFARDGILKFPDKSFYYANKILLQPDGKLLIGEGYDYHFNGKGYNLFRYLLNGTPDSTFGMNGLAQAYGGWYDAEVKDISTLPDGRILACGTSDGHDGNIGDFQFTIIRFAANGAFDSSFGNKGYAYAGFGTGFDIPASMAVQTDGRILVTGRSGGIFGPTSKTVIPIACFRPDGALDTSFNHTGMLSAPYNDTNVFEAVKIAALANGRILVAGNVRVNSSASVKRGVLFCCLPDGTPDTTFAPGGFYDLNFGDGQLHPVSSMELQADGKILVGCDFLARLAIMEKPVLPKTGAFSIYPNPTKGAVTITAAQSGRLSLSDVSGRKLADFIVTEGSTALQLPASVARGMYVWYFRGQDGGTMEGKLLIW